MGNCESYERSVNSEIQRRGGLDMMTVNQIPPILYNTVKASDQPCALNVRAKYVKILNETHANKNTPTEPVSESMMGSLAPEYITIISIVVCLILMLIGLLLYRRYQRKKIVRNMSSKKKK